MSSYETRGHQADGSSSESTSDEEEDENLLNAVVAHKTTMRRLRTTRRKKKAAKGPRRREITVLRTVLQRTAAQSLSLAELQGMGIPLVAATAPAPAHVPMSEFVLLAA